MVGEAGGVGTGTARPRLVHREKDAGGNLNARCHLTIGGFLSHCHSTELTDLLPPSSSLFDGNFPPGTKSEEHI